MGKLAQLCRIKSIYRRVYGQIQFPDGCVGGAACRWVWAFEFVFVLGLAATLVSGHLRSTRVMWTGLLAVLCVLKIFGSDTFLCASSLFGTRRWRLILLNVAGFNCLETENRVLSFNNAMSNTMPLVAPICLGGLSFPRMLLS